MLDEIQGMPGVVNTRTLLVFEEPIPAGPVPAAPPTAPPTDRSANRPTQPPSDEDR